MRINQLVAIIHNNYFLRNFDDTVPVKTTVAAIAVKMKLALVLMKLHWYIYNFLFWSEIKSQERSNIGKDN